MELRIHFPEPLGKEVNELPDRDTFIRNAVAQALKWRRAAERPEPSSEDSRSREASPPLNAREREDAWRREHRQLLQDQFAGQWVVLEGEEIVAHSQDPAQAVSEARAKGIAVPFVFYVEGPRPPGTFRLGL